MSAAEGEPEGVSQGGPDGPGLEEALELLRSLHKKVGKLEKKLEAGIKAFKSGFKG